jgi:hypothetical protein
MGNALKTAQYGYTPLRGGDVTAVDTTLSPATAGSTFGEHDRPTSAYRLGEEDNGCIIIFENYDTTPNVNSAVNIWGYAVNGPAEFIAELSLTTGAARINDDGGDVYTDTITRVNDVTDGHVKKITIADSGNDRVAKVFFDDIGYRWIYPEVYDLTTGAKINPMIRPF